MCILITTVVTPAKADTVADDNSNMDLFIEYDDFFSNENTYHDLVRAGYTVYIHVGKEHEEDMLERLQNCSNRGELLSSNAARGLSRPTETYDITEKGTYYMEGWAYSGSLYTEYKFTGIKGYGIALFNYSQTDELKVDPHGFYEFGSYFKLNPGYCVLKYMTTYYSTDKVYLEFMAPCNVKGYIGTYDDVKQYI